MDKLIQIFEPVVSILVVEIRTHIEHDVVGSVLLILLYSGLDEQLHLFFNIVVV